MRMYVLDAIRGFLRDPPDSEFQRGYLAALICVYEEAEDDVAIPEEIEQAKEYVYDAKFTVSD